MCWLLAAFFALSGVSTARADDDDEPIDVTGRRGRILTLQAETVGVLVADDRVWVPTMPGSPVSVCGPRQCLPIAETETCETPACPGSGTLVIAEGDLGDVDAFPDDPEDFNAEVNAMRSDQVLATIAGYFGSLSEDEDEGIDFVASIGAVATTLGDGGGLLPGADGTIGFRIAVADDDGDWDGLEQSLIGDRFRFEIHGFAVFDTGDQAPGAIQAVAFRTTLRNRVSETILEVPTLLGLALPELGVIFRDERAAFYAGFNIPFRVHTEETADFGFEVDARIGLAAWGEEEGSPVLVSVSLRGGFE
jgi:hypothetical protein